MRLTTIADIGPKPNLRKTYATGTISRLNILTRIEKFLIFPVAYAIHVVGLANTLTKVVKIVIRVNIVAYSGTTSPSHMCKMNGVSKRMGKERVNKR